MIFRFRGLKKPELLIFSGRVFTNCAEISYNSQQAAQTTREDSHMDTAGSVNDERKEALL